MNSQGIIGPGKLFQQCGFFFVSSVSAIYATGEDKDVSLGFSKSYPAFRNFFSFDLEAILPFDFFSLSRRL